MDGNVDMPFQLHMRLRSKGHLEARNMTSRLESVEEVLPGAASFRHWLRAADEQLQLHPTWRQPGTQWMVV
jgi:hypothetical protein